MFCPGFSQDRVNFHKMPGGDPARRADPTWPNRTGYSIPRAAILGSGWGAAGRQEGSHGSGAHAAGGGESGSVHFRCLFCIFSLSLLLLLLFASFAVLLNCPYSDPPVFFLFLTILLPTPAGGGATKRPCGPWLLARGQTMTCWYSKNSCTHYKKRNCRFRKCGASCITWIKMFVADTRNRLNFPLF